MIIASEIEEYHMTEEQDPKNPLMEPPAADLTPEEADANMERFFTDFEAELEGIPESAIRAGAQKMVDFLKGEVTWGEIFDLSPETMQRITEAAYLKLDAGRLEEAERFFKVLTMLNWNNPYYHSMLGVVYQRQERPGEAIAQFSEAIKQNPRDGISLLNRAAIFLQYGWVHEAQPDLEAVLAIEDPEHEEWHAKAQAIMDRLDQMKANREASAAEAAGDTDASTKGAKKKGTKKGTPDGR
jgi:tetratricopeptide (TPR) repeat protein